MAARKKKGAAGRRRSTKKSALQVSSESDEPGRNSEPEEGLSKL